jgi:ligand-binding SRPBCC domain-containing protein
MPVFTRSCLIPAPPEALFRFHENPHNLRAISPPSTRILALEAATVARPGDRFTVKVRQGPLTLEWVGQWAVAEPPHRLVDTGVRCPFAVWRHEHVFEPAEEGGSRLTDRVEFRLPWFRGGVPGDFFALHFVFPRMFAARHAATRRYFESPPS